MIWSDIYMPSIKPILSTAALQALTAVTTAVLFELRSQALISAVAAVTAALGVQQSQAAAPSRAVQVSV